MANSPTLRRRELARKLRELRTAAGLRIEDVAQRAELDKSTISRWEGASLRPRLHALRAVLDVYGADDATKEQIVQLSRDSAQRGWWQHHEQYGDAMVHWFETLVDLESVAAKIYSYEPLLVPGLLQTEDYARALMRVSGRGLPAAAIDQRVALRTGRQALLDAEAPPLLWFVLDQAALTRPVGGAEVLRGQLGRLLDASELPCVRLQVVPWSAGAYMSQGQGFVILTVPDHPEVVYVEYRGGALYLEKPHQIEPYRVVFEELQATAESPERSRELIRQLLTEI